MTLDARQGFYIKIAVLIAVLAAVVIGFDMSNFARLNSGAIIFGILITQLPLFMATFFGACRHAQLVRIPPAPVKTAMAAFLLSAGINLVTPGRVAELIKATYMRLKLGIPLSNGTASVVVERLFDVCIVAAISLMGFVGVLVEETKWLVAVLAIALLGMMLLKPIAKKVAQILEDRKGRFIAFIRGNCLHVNDILTWNRLALTLGLSLGTWCMNYTAVWLFFAVQPDISLTFAQTAIVFGAMSFAIAAPALPGGVGAVQAAVTFVLTQMGFGVGEALALSIGLHISQILMAAISAPIIMLTQPIGVADLLKDIKGKKV